MRRLFLGVAAVLGLAATSPTASAQHNRTVINNSGNGANNVIGVRNGGGVPLFAPGGFGGHHGGHHVSGYTPGFGGGGFAPDYGFPGGGVNRTVIRDSGNGIGNTIGVRNGGGFGGGYPFGPGGFGVNVNVITNSGNGIGNTITTSNRNTGGLNINVITNSGNGIGNTIGVRNR